MSRILTAQLFRGDLLPLANQLSKEALARLNASNRRLDTFPSLLQCYGLDLHFKIISSKGFLAHDGFGWHIVVNKLLDNKTQRYTIAHELAHYIILQKHGLTQESAEEQGVGEHLEELCDIFASLVLASPNVVRSKLCGQKSITFEVIERSARELHVPLRAILHSVKAAGGLGQSSQFIFSFRPNPLSGTLTALHYCTIVPNTVHLSRHLTAESLGLLQLSEGWHNMILGREYQWDERVTFVSEDSNEDDRELPECIEGKMLCKRYGNVEEGTTLVGLFSASNRKSNMTVVDI